MIRWFRLTYPSRLMNQPIIYQLVKRFDVVTNIFQAKVETESGWIVLEMQGSEVALASAIAWLTELGVVVEEVEPPSKN